MNVPVETVVAKLHTIILESPSRRVIGARLGALLKAALPDFSPTEFQCRNLRDFIQKHGLGIQQTGRSGPDFVYGLPEEATVGEGCKSAPNPIVDADSAPNEFSWRAFSNPSYPSTLWVHKETGEFTVSQAGEQRVEPWHLLEKPSTADHFALASSFVATLEEPAQTALSKILGESKWFINFSGTARRLGVGTDWAIYRTEHLRKLLNEQLKTIRGSASTSVSEQPRTELRSAAAERVRPSYSTKRLPLDESALRRLVSLVVADLPMSDLRELNLPVGRVFDHIREILK